MNVVFYIHVEREEKGQREAEEEGRRSLHADQPVRHTHTHAHTHPLYSLYPATKPVVQNLSLHYSRVLYTYIVHVRTMYMCHLQLGSL